MGLENDHQGVIDLVTMKALTFEGEHGEELTETEIPAEFTDLAQAEKGAKCSMPYPCIPMN